MYCSVYKITMRSALCLEYQARARGEAKSRKSGLEFYGNPEYWRQKYRPCLDCPTGRKVLETGGKGMDGDVDGLIAKRNDLTTTSWQICRSCGQKLPLAEFYESKKGSGKYTTECKSCVKKRVRLQKMERTVEKGGSNAENNGVETITCRICGHVGPQHEFHKAGPKTTTICSQCVTKKRQQRQAEAALYQKNVIQIDFTDYPEIKTALENEAKKNFRTVVNEILFRLVVSMKDE